MERARLKYLIDRYTANIASVDELEELQQFVEVGGNKELFSDIIVEPLLAPKEYDIDTSSYIGLAKAVVQIDKAKPVPRMYSFKWRWAAAAVVVLTAGVYLFFPKYNTMSDAVVNKPSPAKTTTSPGGERATLMLADGRAVILDSTTMGQVATQQGARISKTIGGEIVYTPLVNQGEIVYNTMITPRGGIYQLRLPDGTRAMLNAASSITFPTAFIGKERKVKITGEVFFDVKTDAGQPFIVETSGGEIMVLGTQFNVHAYDEEPVYKVSLAEGAIKLNNKLLKPGQAYLNGKVVPTNISGDIAWKNGLFAFKDVDIKAVMRQLARWYNVEVKYAGEPPADLFSGELGRNLTLEEVLDILGSMKIRYKIENKIITIL